jgi:DNA-binding response OmpR family regulator
VNRELRVLVAASAAGSRVWLCEALRAEGLRPLAAASGLEALGRIFAGGVDILLTELEDTEALEELCRRVRRNRVVAALPIVALVDPTGPRERIRALELGADDCVGRTVSSREIALRLRAAVRRAGVTAPAVIERSGILLDRASHRCVVRGRALALTPKEFTLLELLMQEPGRALSREQIRDHLWPGRSRPSLRTVDAHVSRLRSKLGDTREQIECTRGVGYRFCASATARSPRERSSSHPHPSDETRAAVSP